MNSSISQEEIEALFGSQTEQDGGSKMLTPEEVDALGEVGNICMGTAATTLVEILGRRVRITTPRVRVITLPELASQYTLPFVVVEVGYKRGLEGNNVLTLKEDDVRVITDLMMGGDGTNSGEPLSDLHMSAISEAMNQMMGSSATSMSDMLGRPIDISPPRCTVASMSGEKIREIFNDTSDIIQVSFTLEVEGLLNSEIMQLMPIWFGKELVNALLNPEPAVSAPAPVPQPVAPPQQARPQAAAASSAPRAQSAPAAAPRSAPAPMRDPIVDARPMSYTSFDEDAQLPPSAEDGINLIIDVAMQVTIELGKCKKTVKEILEFNTGTILVLEKLAGEPVEVVVNEKLIARGEVIQIDDNYGVRITEIIRRAKNN